VISPVKYALYLYSRTFCSSCAVPNIDIIIIIIIIAIIAVI